MKENPLLELGRLGQSIWLNFLNQGILSSGELQQMMKRDGLTGVATNQAIFKQTMIETAVYDEAIRTLLQEGRQIDEIYQALIIEDVQEAADLFRPLYEQKKNGRDGFVSLEIPLHLAHDYEAIVAEARHLWSMINRPNILLEVPATTAGIEAISTLISEGININAILIFSLSRYYDVVEAYLSGLETRLKQGLSLNEISSVASLCLSRLDVLVDAMLQELTELGGENAELAKRLQGQVATSTAKIVYRTYKQLFSQGRFKKLAEQGANSQRLLWSSASTEDPAYGDTTYVEALIGPGTINCMSLATLEIYRQVGRPVRRLDQDIVEASQVLRDLLQLSINVRGITHQLEREGLHRFIVPYNGDQSRKLGEKLLKLEMRREPDPKGFRS